MSSPLTSRREPGGICWPCLIVLGFSSGFPPGLMGGTLQAWLVDEKVDLGIVGAFSALSLPYLLKFLWAPIMDLVPPPLAAGRRGWILVCQTALVVALAVLALGSPRRAVWLFALSALLVSFLSASLDIAVDAYRAELARGADAGRAAAAFILGYRLATLGSGALALILADHLPWRAVYLGMAAVMGVTALGTFRLEEGTTAEASQAARWRFAAPLRGLLERRHSLEALAFIAIFRAGDTTAAAMTTPFLLGVGFTKTEIGAVSRGTGFAATLAGMAIAGTLIRRGGLVRTLWVVGLSELAACLVFLSLLLPRPGVGVLAVAIGADGLAAGMAAVALIALFTALCERRFTATQYALLSGLAGVTRLVVGPLSGWLAAAVGWRAFFVLSVLLCLPGLFMLGRARRWLAAVPHADGA